MEFLSSRLIMVTGKGGTGKTSLSTAIGVHLADQGKRTLVLEVDNFHPSFKRIFDVDSTYHPTQVSPGLSICNVTWTQALREWLEQTVHSQRVTNLILKNRMATVFLDATPGAREIVILSKIISLMEDFDHVVVDMPASGHAVGILRVPNTAMRLMRSGPIREKAQHIIDVFSRQKTSLGIVCLPEEMVVNETLELWHQIHKEVPTISPPKVFLNRSSDPSLTEDEQVLLSRLESEFTENPDAMELLQAGRWEEELEQATGTAIKRLESVLESSVTTFPRLGALGGFSGGPRLVVEQMSKSLSRKRNTENQS